MKNHIIWDKPSLSSLIAAKPVYDRVILIENESLQRKVTEFTIRHFLAGINIEIVQFTNAAEALLYLENEKQLLIRTALFLDIYMPVLNGWQFLDRFNESCLAITDIYILSSSNNLIDTERARANPKVTGYLKKPIHITVAYLFENTRLAYRSRLN